MLLPNKRCYTESDRRLYFLVAMSLLHERAFTDRQFLLIRTAFLIVQFSPPHRHRARDWIERCEREHDQIDGTTLVVEIFDAACSYERPAVASNVVSCVS
ncbi:hypothetical protein [Caballeronia sp. KNU42]